MLVAEYVSVGVVLVVVVLDGVTERVAVHVGVVLYVADRDELGVTLNVAV